MKTIIHAEEISFQYRHDHVLDHVSFDIHQGEFVGIIGPNGSGKTTLLKILLGLLQPQTGVLTVFDKEVKVGQHSDRIGYIPQKVTQLETRFPITVEEVVMLGRVGRKKLWQRMNSDDSLAVEQALSEVQMLPLRHRLITDLSGGQQQRVFIAKALAAQPELLLLDEPTVGVDVESQEEFYALLAKLHREKGLTIVIVSHDIDVVMNEVDTVLCLNRTLVYHGTPKEFIKEDYLEKLYGKERRFILHNH